MAKGGKKNTKKGGKKSGRVRWGDEDEELPKNGKKSIKSISKDARGGLRKRPRTTQEMQDRQTRLKVKSLIRNKEREKVERISKSTQIELLRPPKKAKKKKRSVSQKQKRSKRFRVDNVPEDSEFAFGRNTDAYDALLSSLMKSGVAGSAVSDLFVRQRLEETGGDRLDSDSELSDDIQTDINQTENNSTTEDVYKTDSESKISHDPDVQNVEDEKAESNDSDSNEVSVDSDPEQGSNLESESEKGSTESEINSQSSEIEDQYYDSDSVICHGSNNKKSRNSESGIEPDHMELNRNLQDSNVEMHHYENGKIFKGIHNETSPYLQHFTSLRPFPEEYAKIKLNPEFSIKFKLLPSSLPSNWLQYAKQIKLLGLEVSYSECYGSTYSPCHLIEDNGKKEGNLPEIFTGNLDIKRNSSALSELGMLGNFQNQWECFNGGKLCSPLQSMAMPIIMTYVDFVHTEVQRGKVTAIDNGGDNDNGENVDDYVQLRRVYMLHILNHILKSCTRTSKHSTKIKREAAVAAAEKQERQLLGNHGKNSKKNISKARITNLEATRTESNSNSKVSIDDVEEDLDWMKDQGFTKPKVLILCPLRNVAYDLVDYMRSLLGKNSFFENWERFEEEYGPEKEEDDIDLNDPKMNTAKAKKRREREKLVKAEKPPDWQALFGEGKNCDDEFKIGISVIQRGNARKKNMAKVDDSDSDQDEAGLKEGKKSRIVKLYSDFYRSDILIASPLGMHLATSVGRKSEDSEEEDTDSKSKEDCDFLSSIEICVVDSSDVMMMQNWEHVVSTLDKVNLEPKRDRGTDFSRVWEHLTHGQGRLWRQNIVLSSISDPSISALVRDQCRNKAGAIRLSKVEQDGTICEVASRVRQVFQRVPCALSEGLSAQDDARFLHFISSVLPALQSIRHDGTLQPHTAIFIPSYYDYVRVRNELLRREQQKHGGTLGVGESSAVFVCEYSRPNEIARSRSWFFQGVKPLLVYTGRAHFFNRFRLRGIKHLIFYGIPLHPQLYPELVNLIDQAESESLPSCLVLYTPFEKASLQRIVGRDRAKRMLIGTKSTFLFA